VEPDQDVRQAHRPEHRGDQHRPGGQQRVPGVGGIEQRAGPPLVAGVAAADLGTAAPAGKTHVVPPSAGCGPGASSRGWSATLIVVGSVRVRVVSSRNSTGVAAGNRSNSTGASAAARASGPTCSSSQIAGTMNSTSLSTNWKACT
jgi:hypothetical protein